MMSAGHGRKRYTDDLRNAMDEPAVHRAWHGIQERRARLRVVRKAWRVGTASAAAAALVAAAGWWVTAGQAPAPTPGAVRLAGGGAVETMQRDAEASTARTWSLADDSKVTLDPGTELRVLESSAERLKWLLVDGRVECHVEPAAERRWTVHAGPLLVEVVGTRFSITRNASHVVVRVYDGVVLVRGDPLKDGIRKLRAGQHLEVGTKPVRGTGPSSRRGRAPTGETRAAASGSAPQGAASPAADAESPPQASASPARPREPTPGAPQAGQRAADLMAEADTARVEGNTRRALSLLDRIAREHAETPQAPLAAFTAGRLRLDQGEPRAAARAFRRALALGLPRAVQQDAYRALVRAWLDVGNRSAAAAAAEEYDRHFPDGRHSRTLEAWLRESHDEPSSRSGAVTP